MRIPGLFPKLLTILLTISRATRCDAMDSFWRYGRPGSAPRHCDALCAPAMSIRSSERRIDRITKSFSGSTEPALRFTHRGRKHPVELTNQPLQSEDAARQSHSETSLTVGTARMLRGRAYCVPAAVMAISIPYGAHGLACLAIQCHAHLANPCSPCSLARHGASRSTALHRDVPLKDPTYPNPDSRGRLAKPDPDHAKRRRAPAPSL